MAKFFGAIGFGTPVQTKPGVHTIQIDERMYCGELLSSYRNTEQSGNLNDNVTMSNQISILADRFARDNFQTMRYVKFRDAKWKITKVEVKHPRLMLTVGGLYNGG
jgi:hypothetical protein